MYQAAENDWGRHHAQRVSAEEPNGELSCNGEHLVAEFLYTLHNHVIIMIGILPRQFIRKILQTNGEILAIHTSTN